MATVSKHGKGWRAQIRRLGYPPLSKTFPLKAQAWSWATETERELLSGRVPHKHTLDDALKRYAENESPKRRGSRWEVLRIGAFRRHRIVSKPLSQLTSDHLAQWRDERLQAVSDATVLREMNLWDSVLETARKEWKWIPVNPLKDVSRPQAPPARRRGVKDSEVAALEKQALGIFQKEVIQGFRLGIETAMRAGEMWSLGRGQIDLSVRVASLEKTKNGDSREVPLSPEAVRIISSLLADGRKALFTVSHKSRDPLFREMVKAAKIPDLHFHDSRSEGISRLSKKMDVLELARVVGHRDPKSLLFYYRANAADIARRLAAP